ncbi:MAG: DUF1328 domain-containing protein [Sulfuriflexus sp.]|nr:DUF1328 domain-containing protein [Sulfuriflexus sp.]MDT8403446.1 DUF1328 domain-containing protein [Sulfuriflexus sp.]
MLTWVLVFLFILNIADVFGFSGIADTGVWIAQILFALFLILFVRISGSV